MAPLQKIAKMAAGADEDADLSPLKAHEALELLAGHAPVSEEARMPEILADEEKETPREASPAWAVAVAGGQATAEHNPEIAEVPPAEQKGIPREVLPAFPVSVGNVDAE